MQQNEKEVYKTPKIDVSNFSFTDVIKTSSVEEVVYDGRSQNNVLL